MKRAIIIGASSGIGREVCKRLLADGWCVGVSARREELLLELQVANPDKVVVEAFDITASDAPDRLLSLIKRMGGVDLYFHSSGMGKQNMELDPAIEAATVDLNVKGFTTMVDTMFNYMAQTGGGHIAVISSIAGTKGLGVAPAYSATKAFQATYIQALEQQSHMRGLGITFTDIRPGFVDTALLAGTKHYPLMMDAETVARDIVRSLTLRRHVRIIDWRYRILVFFWRLIPNALWRRMKVKN